MSDNRRQAVEVFMVLVLYNLFKPVNWTLAQQMLVLGLIPIPMVFPNVLGYLSGSFTALIAPGLADPLATPVFVLELGEPMMILWLALVGATRGRAPVRPGLPARAAA